VIPDIDPATGIPWNGEQMPIKIRSGISLQGTSALDTIIDARLPQFFNCIEVTQRGGTPLDKEQTFIDGFTIRGALMDPNPGAPLPTRPAPLPPASLYDSGAGIVVGFLGWTPSTGPYPNIPHVVISNCFINHCGVGIGVLGINQLVDGEPNGYVVGAPVTIVNNTFADNQFVDIYDGSIYTPMPGWLNYGVNPLRILNNVFSPEAVASFAGVHEACRRATVPPPLVMPAATMDFNAYSPSATLGTPEQGNANFSAGGLNGGWQFWPAATVPTRLTSPWMPPANFIHFPIVPLGGPVLTPVVDVTSLPNQNLVATLRHLLTPGGGLGNKPAFMRNWRCDFSPHLLPDFHPLWAQFPTTDHDTYACNPWFDLNTYRDQRQDLGSGEVRLGVDNPFLYYNPAPGYRAWPGQSPRGSPIHRVVP
jgi:hypothetical protein